MDRRAMELTQVRKKSGTSSNLGRHPDTRLDTRQSRPKTTTQLQTHQNPQVSTVRPNHVHSGPRNLYQHTQVPSSMESRQSLNMEPSASPIGPQHGAHMQAIPPTYSNGPQHYHGNSMCSLCTHVEQPTHTSILEMHPHNVSSGPSHSHRSLSSSLTTEFTASTRDIISLLLKEQEERMAGKHSELLAQFSQVNDRMETLSKTFLEETQAANQNTMKALTLIAQKQQAILQDLQAVKSFVGLDEYAKQPVYASGESASLYQRLTEVTQLVGDWIEKMDDPEANAERRLVDEIREYQKSIEVRNSTPVRHEMGTSPIHTRYPHDEDAAMPTDRIVHTTAARVVHHEMAVSPMRLRPYMPVTTPGATQAYTSIQQETAPIFLQSTQSARNPSEPRTTSVSDERGWQPDGDQQQALNRKAVVNSVSSDKTPAPQAGSNPFQTASSKTLQTSSRRSVFQPALFKDLETTQSKQPNLSPAFWKGKRPDFDGFISTFKPTFTSSPSSVRPVSQDAEVDDSLGGPSFALASKLQKSPSRSSEMAFTGDSRSRRVDVTSVSPTKSSTLDLSSLPISSKPPLPPAETVRQQDLPAPITSQPSDDEDAVANMILDAPSSSQIEPENNDAVQSELVDEDEPSLSFERPETPRRSRPTHDDVSPLFTQSSQNSSQMIASMTVSPAAKPDTEAASRQSQEVEHNITPPSPVVESSPGPSESRHTGGSTSLVAPIVNSASAAIHPTTAEVLEIGSSSPSPPPVRRRQKQPRKTELVPSPAVSVIEISSDDDGDTLPQLPTKMPNSENFSVKREKHEEIPTTSVPATPDAYEPSVSGMVLVATPELEPAVTPEPEPEPGPSTPGLKSKSANLLDDLLTRQLSPITPLPGDDKVKSKKAFDPKKYLDKLRDDEDDVVVTKRLPKKPVRSSPRISQAGSQDSLKDKAAKNRRSSPAGLLKLSKRKGDNLAATRIKKRKVVTKKAVESDDEDLPPLKKATMRPRSDAATVPGSAKSNKTDGKREATNSPLKRKGRPKKKRPQWPEPLPVANEVSEPMIKCDGCTIWFHCSCVAVPPGDIRLKEDEIFYCPVCVAGLSLHRSNKRKASGEGTDHMCGRPECSLETVFFFSKFIGRRWKPGKDSTLVPEYLVRWEGWRLAHATWESAENMGIDNPEEHIEALKEALRKQGLDIDKDQSEQKVILLQEALDAGWGLNGGYNPKWRARHYDSADDLQYNSA